MAFLVTFIALLTKEMRLRLRRERTVWIIVVYLLLMGLLSWLFLNSSSTTYTSTNGPGISAIGINLYVILSQLLLFLIIFMMPAFLANAINGEKERQTYDMLRCSQLSIRTLLSGKLCAGLLQISLFVAATVPLFSPVFFFGGIGMQQILSALIIYSITALWIGTISLLCSLLFARPAVSTAIAYTIDILWFLSPFVIVAILLTSSNGYTFFQQYPDRTRLLFAWNPAIALINTYPGTQSNNPFAVILNIGTGSSTSLTLGALQLPYWIAYVSICLCAVIVCFLAGTLALRLHSTRNRSRERTVPQANSLNNA